MLKELVEYIIQQLVENQIPIKVVTRQEESVLVIEVTVDTKDRGRIIGKNGQTIKALRSFLEFLVPAGTHIVIDLVPAVA